ncbi:MAG: hypothetical protein F2681_11735 [Actinobacteria bacterium]|uniref:Unannotated protein n=1 Tax=freshwater metagenome TaxID=449393 RepID=A0A6J7C557_9ZZZZ|nr:hypothetical protein [Actinomycetota bacterium]MSW78913.1 hypothetical protein [Actinomycetota bacterium]MSX55850.1 hypothetical protein [Actinomycetota bacterium]MSX93007.1 hypothetical protein [Actinomycetota bacterium]MSZ83798.1 hypothetical protein [Actinomycetota bacterium]
MEPTPAEPKRTPRHTTSQRVVLTLNIVVVLACLVGAAALIYGKDQLDGRLQTDKVAVQTTVQTVPATQVSTDDTGNATTSQAPDATFPPADPAAQNFLITGSDANACVEPNSPWAGAADPSRANIGSRSDTIMVMRVDPSTHAAAILSFPRDLWVKIPGKGKNRINAAYVKDDYTLLQQTLYDNFGVVIDHYIQVDFCAFKRIVDGVGGVAVPFDHPIVDRNVGIDVAPAAGETLPFCHTFSGDEALAYARSRHLKWVDTNGKVHEDRAADFGRISRQQDFLRRVLKTALKKGLFDPAVARALIASLQNDIVTEQGFTVDDMLRFAGVMRDVAPDTIRTYQVDSVGSTQGGSSVRLPQIAGKNMKAILAIFQGKAPLAGAPDQVFDTTTTGPGTTGPGSTTTIAGTPLENGVGDILPPKNVDC